MSEGEGVLPRYVHGVMRCTLELDALLDKRAGGTGESAGELSVHHAIPPRAAVEPIGLI